ncbi:MAG: hypothetical protein WAN33_07625 [Candidatus Acidiferrales bacterium]
MMLLIENASETEADACKPDRYEDRPPCIAGRILAFEAEEKTDASHAKRPNKSFHGLTIFLSRRRVAHVFAISKQPSEMERSGA